MTPTLSFEPAEIRGGDSHREAVLPRVDPIDLPAADKRFFNAARITGDLLAVAKRQVVDEAADQPMVDVEVRQAMIALGIVVVEESLPAVEAVAPMPAAADFVSVLLAQV